MKTRIVITSLSILCLFIAIIGSVIGATFSWFNSNYEFVLNYLVPSEGIIVLTFDSPIGNKTGALYPAIVTSDAIAKNKWDDPGYIVKPRGELVYNSSFTYYTGDPETTGNVLASFTAVITKDNSSTRDLFSSGELGFVSTFALRGVSIYCDSSQGYYVYEETNIVYLEDKVAYVLEDQLYIVNNSGYVEPNNAHTIFLNNLLVIPAHQSIDISIRTFMVPPSDLTALDLMDTTVKIKIALSLPDYLGG
ncbi:MAG: hypothetical protein LBF68_04510 [Christensenellaceae bacterium]|jgi:hypothetical protein|nr:hypothetical protein [Christensenellaceae bacterium]